MSPSEMDSEFRIELIYKPAVLVERKDVAFVLDAGDTADVAMSRRKNVVVQVGSATSAVRVLGSVVPQERHHHLAIVVVLPKSRHFCHKRQILGFGTRFEEDAVARPHDVALSVSHGRITLAQRRSRSIFAA